MCSKSSILDKNLNLLFFLSALLAGITGAISGGQRTDAPAVQQSLARAFEASVEADVQTPTMLSRNITAPRSPIGSESAGQLFWAIKSIAFTFDLDRVNEKLSV